MPKGDLPGVKAPFNTTVDHMKLKVAANPGPGTYELQGVTDSTSKLLLDQNKGGSSGFASTTERLKSVKTSNHTTPG